MKARGIKNGIQDKAVKNKLLTQRQRQRNRLILKARYVVERAFGSQVRWFGGKLLRYRGLAKAHTWHILQAMAYNLKRLPKLFVQSLAIQVHAPCKQEIGKRTSRLESVKTHELSKK